MSSIFVPVELFSSTSVRCSLLHTDFVTWRGHLTKLLTTPYETREGWLLAVTRFRGTFYISEVETEAARREQENRTERHEEMMYWGYKFEQYTCTGNPTVKLCFFNTGYFMIPVGVIHYCSIYHIF